MNWVNTYKVWRNFRDLQPELKEELQQMTEWQLKDAFYTQLAFGTGGMRGELGPGPNGMNIYTVRKVTKGLARYIEKQGTDAKRRGVFISYDSRHQSQEFALEAAKTLGVHDIQTYVFEEMRPTPELSFAVRYLHAYAGIMITASHNPAVYNGYKVYGQDGAQLPPTAVDEIVSYMNKVENELHIPVQDEHVMLKENVLSYIGENLDHVYVDYVKGLQQQAELLEKEKLQIVYTPLHGTGSKVVPQALRAFGFTNIMMVTEQESPDPDFSTVASPNPEDSEAFQMAIQYGKRTGAELLLATDPDADRLGIAVKDPMGEYRLLTGNQVGALLIDYLLTQKQQKDDLKSNGVILKTIVTSELGRAIAEDFGMKTVDTLTGFKYIAEKIEEYNRNEAYTFQFGYEESYGYLIGDFVRDKDAVQAAAMITEAAAYYKSIKSSLYERLMILFETYGYYEEAPSSITMKGQKGIDQINDILTDLRANPPLEFGKVPVTKIEDYQSKERIYTVEEKYETIDLPKSNVLKYYLKDGSWVAVRPSGTEPKIKFYFGVTGSSMEESKRRIKELKQEVFNRVETSKNIKK
ncbi:phospho-sugar mutase [Priestia megaterium]|uniref:phospho-sugar mutase n=1 Tax=Priestia megaterium TaxID=1404 RepID=UPI002280DE81|nr:phospho-sugar mutase [Priestia megaterium]MCY9027181.1 phospho-sugar mutase [Priestia megaterium]